MCNDCSVDFHSKSTEDSRNLSFANLLPSRERTFGSRFSKIYRLSESFRVVMVDWVSMGSKHMRISKLSLVALVLTFSMGILYLCYPGFMSYDSIQMLEEARSSVNGGIFPTVPVYILRLFDIGGHGPTVMLLVQNFILLLCFAQISRGLDANLVVTAVSMFVFLSVPTIIGCMLVLWKDVTLMALMMASLALIFLVSLECDLSSKMRWAIKWLSLIILIIATLVKFNAVTSTIVLAIYWVSIFLKNQSIRIKFINLALIFACMVFSNKIVNGYSFPYFNRLAPNNLVYGIMVNDLVGISKWSGISLVPFDVPGQNLTPKSSILDIERIYTSLGSAVMHDNNVRSGSAVKLYPPKYAKVDIVKAWSAAVIQHPSSYIRYRWDLFSEIIGATGRPTYEPTHFNKIDENRFGIKFQERATTTLALNYIEFASGVFFGKPWFIFLLSSFAFLIINKTRHIKHEFKMLSNYSYVAAFLNITPYFLVTLSGEVRYSFAALVLCSIPISVLLLSIGQGGFKPEMQH